MRAAYTLIEILVATVLSLMLLGAVVKMFGDVGQGITDSRSLLETADRLRLTVTRLQQDLGGLTVTMAPPRKPESNEGYFEYIEGPVGAAQVRDTSGTVLSFNPAVNSDLTAAFPNNIDSTAGDYDDVLMFTTRSTGRPFVGKFAPTGAVQSDVAEVAWFLRGRTLHRRVLLVAPGATGISLLRTRGFYAGNDISVRWNTGSPWQKLTDYVIGDVVTPTVPNGYYYVCTGPGQSGNTAPTSWTTTEEDTVTDGAVTWTNRRVVAANTLGDLTRRENRFAHPATTSTPFQHDVRSWMWRYVLPVGWNVYVSPAPSWALNTFYQVGDVVFESSHCYVCTKAGTSSGTKPSWPTNGTTVTDGTVSWTDQPQSWFDIPAIPTLRECSSANWTVDVATPPVPTTINNLMFGTVSRVATGSADRPVDLWDNTVTKYMPDNAMTNVWVIPNGSRIADDVILTNVIGFDVKGWSGTAMDYVDVNHATIGYDTWSTSDDDPQGSDGFDNDADGIVDNDAEKQNAPPYPTPLRGIQVKIRVFEPDSRQIREVTVVQDFLPQ